VCFVVCKTISEQECTISTTLYVAGAKTHQQWVHQERGFAVCFSSRCSDGSLICDRCRCDGECLTCSEFSLGETVHHGNFEFIIDYFGDLSLSPRRGNTGATFMGSTHNGEPTPLWAVIEDSTEEFLTVPSREGSFAPPLPLPEGMTLGLYLLPSQPHHG
jgi:hypothetical protein